MITNCAFFCSISLVTVLVPARTKIGFFLGWTSLPLALASAIFFKRCFLANGDSGRYFSNNLNNWTAFCLSNVWLNWWIGGGIFKRFCSTAFWRCTRTYFGQRTKRDKSRFGWMFCPKRIRNGRLVFVCWKRMRHSIEAHIASQSCVCTYQCQSSSGVFQTMGWQPSWAQPSSRPMGLGQPSCQLPSSLGAAIQTKRERNSINYLNSWCTSSCSYEAHWICETTCVAARRNVKRHAIELHMNDTFNYSMTTTIDGNAQ